MSNDNKLRALLVFRLDQSKLFGSRSGDEETGSLTTPGVLCLAKYDHLNQYEAHRGSGLCLYGDRDKEYERHIALMISKDPPSPPRGGDMGGFKVVNSDSHQLVYGTDADGLCVAVVSGKKYASRVAVQMLMDLHKDFLSKFGIMQIKNASADALTKKAKPVLSAACNKYGDVTKVDKAAAINAKVDEVKMTMQDNISQMLQNQEKVEGIAEVSNQLNEQAQVFKKTSKTLKKEMKWKDMKMTIIIACVVVGIILMITIPLIMKAKALAGK
jgi:hypothetical protein